MAEKNEMVGYTPRDISTVLYGGEGSLPKPFSKSIPIWSGFLCGCQFTFSILDLIKEIKKEDKLRVLIENPEDEYAIAVKDMHNNRLGYIPKENNQILLNLLGAGKLIVGEIAEVRAYNPEEGDYRPWEMIKVHLFMED